MNIYIAGRGDTLGIKRYRALQALVLQAGHFITHDWTVAIERAGESDRDLTLEQRRPYADTDAEGVLHADVLVYQAPHEKSEGAAYEMGAHHMKRDLILSLVPSFPILRALLPIASICVGAADCLFASRCDHHVETNDEVIALLVEIAKQDQAGAVLTAHALGMVSKH